MRLAACLCYGFDRMYIKIKKRGQARDLLAIGLFFFARLSQILRAIELPKRK